MIKKTILILALLFIFTACSKPNKELVSSTVSETTEVTAADTVVPKDTVPAPTAAVAPVATTDGKTETPNILPVLENTTGKTTLQVAAIGGQYLFNSYLITTQSGTKLLLDEATNIKKEVLDFAPDFIGATHSHPDHYQASFIKQYPDAAKILYTVEDITVKDAHIYSIASSHSQSDINLKRLSNSLIVIEVDGLRIAHLGDMGQETLTDEQLTQLGSIDIAFTQFVNSYSNMTNENMLGYNLIAQVNPKIIIPTHYDDASITMLTDKYGEIEHYTNLFALSKDDLPETTKVVIIDNTLTTD